MSQGGDRAGNPIVSYKLQRWLGHVIRMDEDAPPRRVFDAVVGCHRRKGRPRTRWKDQVGEALTSLGVTNWRRRAQSRDAGQKL